MQAANWMGATKVVFHIGTVSGQDRAGALLQAKKLLVQVLEKAEQKGYLERVLLCPETMGKSNQMGTLSEVISLCSIHPKVRPAVDFGHIHARLQGCLHTTHDYEQVFQQIASKLGEEAIQSLHIHFSPIEFDAKGEKRHRTLYEKEFGPDFYPLAQFLAKHRFTPTIICESAGMQTEDALAYQKMYDFVLKGNKKL